MAKKLEAVQLKGSTINVVVYDCDRCGRMLDPSAEPLVKKQLTYMLIHPDGVVETVHEPNEIDNNVQTEYYCMDCFIGKIATPPELVRAANVLARGKMRAEMAAAAAKAAAAAENKPPS